MSTRHVAGSGRAEILAAAIREFADHGYAGATTAGIARRAGVTQPLVHHHFGSKQGLWHAVLGELFQELRAVMEVAQREVEGADRATRLEHLLRAFVCFSGRRPELSRLIRTESSAGGEAFEDLFESRLSVSLSFLLKELSAAVEDGTIRPVDSRFAYFAIIGASTQAFAQPELARRAFGLDVKDEQAIARYADLVVELVTRGLRATPEGKRPAARKGPASRSKQR
ncbi:TetR/AcrR family transcriptional regulator [Archangium lipolyticum]|uniref:TetR/AcrR family transcriptional regulator n=1 Tax=Archangium lipolyticum TaxID=2970465 RepID=UPI002149D283|nr:TetR/AcrR family transcriptional regulator [Archangium lipolyticum]